MLFAGAMVLVSGCVKYQERPLYASTAAVDFQARSLNAPGLKQYFETIPGRTEASWPLPAWDAESLVLAALYFNPGLDVARAKWEAAQARQDTAAERPNPVLSVTPAYNTSTAIPSPWLVTPSLEFPIETAGKRRVRISQTQYLAEAARLNLVSEAWRVRSGVMRAWFDWSAARQMADLLESQQSLQDECVRLLEQQYQAGSISAFELTQARLAANNLRLVWQDAQRQSAEARVQLAETVGVPARALDNVRFNSEEPPLPAWLDSITETQLGALLHRSDILSALSEYAAAQTGLQLEIAKQYPDFHLSPGYEFDQGDHKWSLGISVTLPVFNRNQGAIREAIAHRDEMAATFIGLQAKVIAEIERAVASYRAALSKTIEVETLLLNCQQQEKTAQRMFSAGEISRSDWVGLRLQLGTTVLARQDARAKFRQALMQLGAAFQCPVGFSASAWPPPLPSKSSAHEKNHYHP